MTNDPRLNAVIAAITEEASRNPRFMDELQQAITKLRDRRPVTRTGGPLRRQRRRAAALIDPFEALRSDGRDGLRSRLAALTLEQLRDVVAEYGIEPYTLAMKWKTPSRLIDLITDTIEQRSRKCDAFR